MKIRIDEQDRENCCDSANLPDGRRPGEEEGAEHEVGGDDGQVDREIGERENTEENRSGSDIPSDTELDARKHESGRDLVDDVIVDREDGTTEEFERSSEEVEGLREEGIDEQIGEPGTQRLEDDRKECDHEDVLESETLDRGVNPITQTSEQEGIHRDLSDRRGTSDTIHIGSEHGCDWCWIPWKEPDDSKENETSHHSNGGWSQDRMLSFRPCPGLLDLRFERIVLFLIHLSDITACHLVQPVAVTDDEEIEMNDLENNPTMQAGVIAEVEIDENGREEIVALLRQLVEFEQDKIRFGGFLILELLDLAHVFAEIAEVGHVLQTVLLKNFLVVFREEPLELDDEIVEQCFRPLRLLHERIDRVDEFVVADNRVDEPGDLIGDHRSFWVLIFTC